jgi:hypothetical protein
VRAADYKVAKRLVLVRGVGPIFGNKALHQQGAQAVAASKAAIRRWPDRPHSLNTPGDDEEWERSDTVRQEHLPPLQGIALPEPSGACAETQTQPGIAEAQDNL